MVLDPEQALSDAITAVQQTLSAIEGAGAVLDYIPLITTEAAFEETFKTKDNTIVGWSVTRESTATFDKTLQANVDEHLVIVRGYMGIGDGGKTERVFQRLIEVARNKFKLDRKLGGKVYYCKPMGARLVTSGVMGNVLCHYCELTLPVQIYPLIN